MLSARDLPLLPVFVAVADRGSFTAAARDLNLAKSVVSQHIRTLEARCGVRLLERTTRRIRVTQPGEHILDAARSVLASVHALDRVLEGQREEPSGTLRLTAPNDVELTAVISRTCAALMRQHPQLKVDLVFDDNVRDLVKDGFDLAIRGAPIVESSSVARKLGTELEVVVASPTLVDTRPVVTEPRHLMGAPWVAHAGIRNRALWTFRTDAGDKQRVSVDLRATVDSAAAMRHLLLAGAGYGVFPSYMVRDDLDSGRIVRVASPWFVRRVSFHVLLPTRQPPPRVRVFLTALNTALRPLGFGR